MFFFFKRVPSSKLFPLFLSFLDMLSFQLSLSNFIVLHFFKGFAFEDVNCFIKNFVVELSDVGKVVDALVKF